MTLLNGKKYYYTTCEEVKVGHIVTLLEDYPGILPKGTICRVRKVFIKEIGPPVDYILVDFPGQPKKPDEWVIHLRRIRKATSRERKTFYHELRMHYRALMIGKKT